MDTPLKSLIKRMFEKAEVDSGNKTKNGRCNYLETTFRDDLKCYEGTSSKSFSRLYDKYIVESHPENADPKPGLLEVMSHYLGFESYRDFLVNYNENDVENSGNLLDSKKRREAVNTERIVILILGLVIFSMLIFNFIIGIRPEPKCMIWKQQQFVEISCDLSIHPKEAGNIKAFDKKLFKNMKLIPGTEVKLGSSYYYKVNRDSIEFYSWRGKHPVDGGDLKPVTKYIIEKYIQPQG